MSFLKRNSGKDDLKARQSFSKAAGAFNDQFKNNQKNNHEQ